MGPINATAPEPVTNKAFTKALGRAIHRPTIAPIPAAALKLLFGEMADVVTGQNAVPERAASRLRFAYPELDEALETRSPSSEERAPTSSPASCRRRAAASACAASAAARPRARRRPRRHRRWPHRRRQPAASAHAPGARRRPAEVGLGRLAPALPRLARAPSASSPWAGTKSQMIGPRIVSSSPVPRPGFSP